MGAEKKLKPCEVFFLRPLVPKIQNARVPATYRNLGHIHAPLFPSPSQLNKNKPLRRAGGKPLQPAPFNKYKPLQLFFSGAPFFRNPFCTTQYPTSTVSFFFSQPHLLKSELPPIRRTKKAPFFGCREPAPNFDLGKVTQSRPGPARPGHPLPAIVIADLITRAGGILVAPALV